MFQVPTMPNVPVVRVAAIGNPYWLLPLNERWLAVMVIVSIAAGHVKAYLRCAAFTRRQCPVKGPPRMTPFE